MRYSTLLHRANACFVLTAWVTGLVTCTLAIPPQIGHAAATFPGECGKPTKGLNPSAPENPVAADALYALKAGVGQPGSPCVKYICDVDGNGTVLAQDALLILRKAVGQSATFSCPACVNSDNTYCNCTQTEVLNKLGQDPNFTNKPSNDVAALFGCSDFSKTYAVTDAEWTTARREIVADDVWLHGAGVTIVPSAPCYPAGQENDPINDATNCPDSGTGAKAIFMKFVGDQLGITGFTVKGFVEGLHFAGENGTAGNMVFDRICDSAVTNLKTLGIGNEVRNSVFRRGCDKCVEDGAGPTISGSCSGRSCYHMAYYDSDFEGCSKSVRFSSDAVNGRFLLDGTREKPLRVCPKITSCSTNSDCGGSSVCTTTWACQGAEMGANNVQTTLIGVTVDGCKSGIVFGNGTHTLGGEARIVNGVQRGIFTKGGGSSVVLDTKIVNNGGQTSDEHVGGAVATGASVLNLGSSMSNGHNCIYDNKNGGEGGLEVNNRVPDLALQARYNWWNNGGNEPPSGELVRSCSDNPMVPCTTNADCGGSNRCNTINTSNRLSSGQAPAFCSQ